MLTTKERAPEDVPTPASGHSTLFVHDGALKLKDDAGATGAAGGSGSWAGIFSTTGSHTLVTGALVVNRFRADLNIGVVLVMPASPVDGTIVNIKEASGNQVNSVQVSAGGSGSVEDANGGFSQPSTIANPAGIAVTYQYDIANTAWRIVRYYNPAIPAV